MWSPSENERTFSPPHWHDYTNFNHEYNGRNDDRRQCRLRNVEEQWCHKQEGEYDQHSGVQ